MSETNETTEKDVKRVRAGYLANATRKLKEFQDAVNDEEKRSTLDSLRKAYKDFVAAHDRYLETGPQEEDLKRAADQYYELMKEMLNAEQIVSQLQHSPHSVVTASSRRSKASTSNASRNKANKARLAEAEVRKKFLLQQQTLERRAAELAAQLRHQEEETQRQVQLLEVEQEIAIAQELVVIEKSQPASSNSSQILQEFQSFPPSCAILNQATANATNNATEKKTTDPPPMTSETKHDSLPTLARLLRQTPALPQLEMIKFSGDPALFAEFYTSFRSNIEVYVENNTERLTRLIASCTGKAAEAIRSCVNLPSDVQYQTAWTTLKENFGQPHYGLRSANLPIEILLLQRD